MSAYVLFFGGFQATQTQINIWAGSAKAQKPDVTFDGYAYPASASARGASAVSAFKASGGLAQAIGTVQECATDQVYLVGHSSGCAIANAVDKEVTKGLTDKSKFVLVALDGYRPDKDQLNRDNTQVWGAVSGAHKSYHYPDADEKKKLGKNFKEFKASSGVTARFALHFSLVNTAITNDTGNTEHGYDNCQANLKWVDEELKVTTP